MTASPPDRDRRRPWRIAAGVALLLAGVAMLVLPGPGWLTILAALAWLERDVPALQRWTAPLRERIRDRLVAWGTPPEPSSIGRNPPITEERPSPDSPRSPESP